MSTKRNDKQKELNSRLVMLNIMVRTTNLTKEQFKAMLKKLVPLQQQYQKATSLAEQENVVSRFEDVVFEFCK